MPVLSVLLGLRGGGDQRARSRRGELADGPAASAVPPVASGRGGPRTSAERDAGGGVMSPWQALLEGFGQLLSAFFDLIPNYGVAILMLTVTVRLVMVPLTIKQTRSFQAMQKLQPEVRKLQDKYKGKEDRQKLNEEMMKLYREHNANPFGGCLPMVLQFPVFIGLFRVLNGCRAGKGCIPGVRYLPKSSALRAALVTGGATFAGMDLRLTPNQAVGRGVIQALPYLVLVLLMVLTGWYQQKQMSAVQPTGQQAAQMQTVFKIMPIMFGFFSLNFPAGLTVYWVASNIWTIGQQYLLVSRVARPAEAPAAAEPSPNGKSRSGGGGRSSADGGEARSGGSAKHKGSGARRRRRRR